MQGLVRHIVVVLIAGAIANDTCGFADSVSEKRLSYTTLAILEAGGHLSAFTGLYFLWYRNYPQTRFHFFNDLPEWLQMDKAGHFFSGYWLTRLQTYVWKQTGYKRPALMGALWSAVAMTGIEILDGFSAKWGASVYDALANFIGISLALWQYDNPKLLVFPSFSFHPIRYPSKYEERARQLYGTFPVSLLKDYNGQTYWISMGHRQWVILPSFGYSAEGMLGGMSNCWIQNEVEVCADIPRQRQFLISFTLNWKKLKVNWKHWKKLASVLDVIKLPAPALMFSVPDGSLKFYLVYF